MNKNIEVRIYDLEAERVIMADRLEALEQALHRLKAETIDYQMSPYITPAIVQALELVRKNTITQVLGGVKAPAYLNEHLRAITYHEAEAAFKFRFQVTRYDQLRMCDKEEAMDFWQHWFPPRQLLKRILHVNGVPGMRDEDGDGHHGY